MKLPPQLEEVQRRVRVLRDRVLVMPIEYRHPVLATVGVNIQKGLVVGVGYGRRKRRKTPFKQKMAGHGTGLDRTLYFEDGEETGSVLPMRVNVGDVIEFSFRNATTVPFDRIYDKPGILSFPGVKDLLFVWQNAIMTVDPEESASDALLWQQSAGYDRHGNFMSGKEAWTRGS